jgi:hypothetical protein
MEEMKKPPLSTLHPFHSSTLPFDSNGNYPSFIFYSFFLSSSLSLPDGGKKWKKGRKEGKKGG